jgi:hypothetical protein
MDTAQYTVERERRVGTVEDHVGAETLPGLSIIFGLQGILSCLANDTPQSRITFLLHNVLQTTHLNRASHFCCSKQLN